MQSKYLKRSSEKKIFTGCKREFLWVVKSSEFLPQFLAKTKVQKYSVLGQSRNRQFLAETRPEQLPRKQFFDDNYLWLKGNHQNNFQDVGTASITAYRLFKGVSTAQKRYVFDLESKNLPIYYLSPVLISHVLRNQKP